MHLGDKVRRLTICKGNLALASAKKSIEIIHIKNQKNNLKDDYISLDDIAYDFTTNPSKPPSPTHHSMQL